MTDEAKSVWFLNILTFHCTSSQEMMEYWLVDNGKLGGGA
jgi:hypothetical protein